MKLDVTIAAHISDETNRKLQKMLEFEHARGNEHLTVSTLINRLICEYISTHEHDYELLKTVFGENRENGKN